MAPQQYLNIFTPHQDVKIRFIDLEGKREGEEEERKRKSLCDVVFAVSKRDLLPHTLPPRHSSLSQRTIARVPWAVEIIGLVG